MNNDSNNYFQNSAPPNNFGQIKPVTYGIDTNIDSAQTSPPVQLSSPRQEEANAPQLPQQMYMSNPKITQQHTPPAQSSEEHFPTNFREQDFHFEHPIYIPVVPNHFDYHPSQAATNVFIAPAPPALHHSQLYDNRYHEQEEEDHHHQQEEPSHVVYLPPSTGGFNEKQAKHFHTVQVGLNVINSSVSVILCTFSVIQIVYLSIYYAQNQVPVTTLQTAFAVASFVWYGLMLFTGIVGMVSLMYRQNVSSQLCEAHCDSKSMKSKWLQLSCMFYCY